MDTRTSICSANNGDMIVTTPTTPAVMTINEFRDWARLSRTRIYEEIGKGSLCAIKVGRRTLITTEAARAWLESQPAYGEA